MKKLLILTTLLASMTLVACGNDDPGSNPPAPGPTGVRLDIDKTHAVENLLNLAKTSGVKITYTDYSLTDPVSRYFACNSLDLFWEMDINSDEYVHEFFTNESENIQYDRYKRDSGETTWTKAEIDKTVSARTTFGNARESAWSKLFFAHILDENSEYKKSGEDTIAERTVQIYDRDTDTAHERYWVDKTIGITLRHFEYYDSSKTEVSSKTFEVTSFVTGSSVVPPSYK